METLGNIDKVENQSLRRMQEALQYNLSCRQVQAQIGVGLSTSKVTDREKK